MKHVVLGLSSAALFALAGTAQAGISGLPGWDMVIETSSGAPWVASENTDSFTITQIMGSDGHIRYRVIGGASGDGWSLSWNTLLDPDPFISSSFTVQNMSGMTQDFTITTTLPIFPVLTAPTTMTGSISGTVGDGDGMLDPNGNGATVTTQANGRPYYEALVDGLGVRSLYAAPQTHTAPLGLTAAIPTQNFINEVGPGVLNTIGIRNAFTLTSSDNAAFTSTFVIIPAPTTLGAFGLIAAAAVRRRR